MKKLIITVLGVIIIPLLFILIPFSKISLPPQYIIFCCILLSIAIVLLVLLEASSIIRLVKKPKYLLESMVAVNTPLRGREIQTARISTFFSNENQNTMLIEGESGLGKTSIISAYIAKAKNQKQFDVIIWQPLIDLPTTREIVNNWLNIYTDNIPDIGFNARLDAFLRKARENKHKKILIVFDNCESMLQTDGGHINLPKDFLTLITRLTMYQECKIKIVITSAVDLRHILPPEINPFIVSVEKLSNNILSQIVYDRTSFTMDEADFEIAHGNPSAALLIAEMVKKGVLLLDETNQAMPFAALVDKRMQLLNDEQQKLVELLSIIKYPMLVSEIQDLWKLLPPYSSISQFDITDLQQTFLIEKISENKFLINPLVASVIEAKIIDDLSKAIVCQKIEDTSIIRKFPLDYVRWPQIARNNVSRYIFPSVVENLNISYQFSIQDINKETIVNILQKHASDKTMFLSSNIVTFFLFCGIELNDILFPSLSLIGVDFSQVHLFNTDLSNVNVINCQFADRIGSIYAVQFMKEDFLIIGLASGSIELRKTSNLLRITRTETHSQPIRAICYSETNGKIVSGGEDGRIVIYDENLTKLKSIEMHSQWIWQIIKISDDYVLTIACGGYIGVIDLKNNYACGKFTVPSQRIWKAAICEQEIFFASEDGILWKCSLCDILSMRQPKWEIAINIQEPIKACCSCAENVILGCRDGKVLWVSNKGEHGLLANEDSCIRDICRIKNSNKIITVGDSGIAHIYDVENYKLLGEFQAQSSRTWAIDTLSNGVTVTVGDDRTVHLWDATENISLKVSCGNGQSLRDVDIYQGNNIFACSDDFLRVQNESFIEPWKTLRRRKRILGFVSLKSNRWACSFEDGVVLLGDCEKILLEINAHNSAIESMARNSDGTLFATGSEDRVIKIYDNDGVEQNSPKPLHNSRIWSLSFSPDNLKLASAGGDFIVAIWDIRTGDFLGSCLGHNNLVLSLCWLDNNNIVSAGTDGTIRLWDINTSSCLDMKAIPCLIRGLATDGSGIVYGVGRNSNEAPGWIVLKWDTNNNELKIKQIDIFGGSAKSILFIDGKVYLGGDMPFWIEINPVTLDIINQFRIPGIYYGLQIDANKSEGADYDCLTLLGAHVLGR